ncbi:TIGR04282 family arsenosugar biosynthesis glycosyltransferase [Fundidesulfovibrio putealis]|uniref:TIGR04282 family arsenosugar biosynthesis glycosyltransferase n=1 Tax=Fundidesulfovibrio putealis TaxID=270496 RepID=UPI001969C505|nr:TIGR04282 family arsenosugar biosynthesis glycosyltransferase [Fundidesulfovibrio putealis]
MDAAKQRPKGEGQDGPSHTNFQKASSLAAEGDLAPMTNKICLLFMLRAPLHGKVKTRLAREVGHDAALALYKAFVEDMLDSLDGCGADIAFFVEPGEGIGEMRAWLGDGRVYVPQCHGNLGDRMRAAFEWAFGAEYTAAACIGSDIAVLSHWHAKSLVRLMRSEPALIGPSPDGGYWTIGFGRKSYLPQAFESMPWSTPELFGITMGVMQPLQPATLPELADIDTLEDLRALVRARPAGVARRTLAVAGALLGQEPFKDQS